MTLPAIMQRYRAVRWLAPAGVLCIAALAANGVYQANASSEPAATTPARLLAEVRSADVTGFSGTVVSQLSLGLPPLPTLGAAGDAAPFAGLLSGSHTMQVWYGGPGKQRVALLGSDDETDVFREFREVWEWNSADRVAVHTILPAGSAGAQLSGPSASTSVSPDQLADRLLGDLDPATHVTVEHGREVADRTTYDLVLMPKTSGTKIGSARIAVDGQTKIPLAVQLYARGAKTPALDIAFTSIRFGAQPERNFEFTPPPNATVRQGTSGASDTGRTTGTGWTTVFGTSIGKVSATRLEHGALGTALTAVSGSWGSGRLLDSALVSVLVTDDGRLFAGAVDPSRLYAAAAHR